ncbi:YgcG family protein [Paracoccus sp. (in: a-proteobacteria)]|uniref:TPM domain-containing protein n=1 Tax=Paracoccus sp. TaxID=267 RepID=UPI0035B34FC2
MRARPALRLVAVLALWLALLVPASGQDLPDWQSTTVNDFAGLLIPEDAAAITRTLTELRDQTGIEGTVVTLTDRTRYGGKDGLEPFATRLFNHWGVGHAARNSGFMLLVLTDQREVRIELGRGYENDADLIAQDIIRGTLLPALRDGRMSQGIRQGTEDIIRYIALPASRGEALQGPQKSLFPQDIGLGLWAALMGLLGLHAWRRKRCPECHRRDFTTSLSPRREMQSDGSYRVAADDLTRTCRHCGWSDSRSRANRDTVWYDREGNPIRSTPNPKFRAGPGRSSGFGGGSSRGGGASGRW